MKNKLQMAITALASYFLTSKFIYSECEFFIFITKEMKNKLQMAKELVYRK